MAIRITQAGVALTVGIIIVTALIIGGFFWVKNSGEQARRDDAIKIAEQNLEKQSGNDVALNDGEADKDASETTPAGNDAAKSDDTATQNTDTSNTPGASNSDQTVSELPQTGPADQLATLFITALLTFSVVSYISSRQQLHNGFLGSR